MKWALLCSNDGIQMLRKVQWPSWVPKATGGRTKIYTQVSDSHLASFLCAPQPPVNSYLPPESENHSLAQCSSDFTTCWPKDHILNSKDLEVTFLLCCLPREMLLADHNLKISPWSGTFQILECQGIAGKLMKQAEFPDPPEELLTGCGLWRTTHLVIRALGNSGVDQRVTLRRYGSVWLNISLGPRWGLRAGVGWGQGVKARKDVQRLPQSSQQSKGMLGIFSQGCRAFLWFCSSADPLLSPPHSVQEMCLSFPTALCWAARFLSGVWPAELKSSTPITSELLSSLTPGVSLLAAARGRFMPPESLTQPHCEILSPWDTKSWQLLKAYSAVSQQISPHDQFEKIKLLLSSSALSYSCMTCWPFRAAQLLSINPPRILSARE